MVQINSNVAWALVSGLAVGYIFGNLVPMHGGGSASSEATDRTISPASSDESIPPEWLTENDIGASAVFAGLTSSQRYLALKVLNTKPCDCGCPHGSIAKCKKEDPACPVAPSEIETAVREARAGKTYDEIFAAVAHPAVMPAAQSPGQAKTYKALFPAGTPSRGPKTAKVTVVEFSDFQCPFCGRVEPALKQVEDTYGNDVRIVWRNIPLPFHEHAMDAAEAALAADAQGKFWPMHDKLFANQGALDRASIDKYASDVGLDMAKFKAAMDHHASKPRIDADMKDGAAAGVNSTPSFFINGQMLAGAQPFSEFKRVIDAELAKANALVAAGTPPEKLYQAEIDALGGPADAR
jgi:protein-disulfide isomerase